MGSNFMMIYSIVLGDVSWVFISPAFFGILVTLFGFDPGFAVVGDFFFPERRFGFKVIHNKFGGSKCVFTMGAVDAHKYNLLA